MINTKYKTRQDYFLGHIDINPQTGCWEWNMKVDPTGYGVVVWEKKRELAHRYSYSHYKGPILGMHVLHSCDNRKCSNPDHLFLGSQKDNVHDMFNKGRDSNKPTFSDSAIREIRTLLSQNNKVTQIAKLFNTSPVNISRIKSGKYYSSIK